MLGIQPPGLDFSPHSGSKAVQWDEEEKVLIILHPFPLESEHGTQYSESVALEPTDTPGKGGVPVPVTRDSNCYFEKHLVNEH